MTSVRPAAGAIRADYPDPLWIQALNLINGEIASGSLKPGMRLPPERELCERLKISRVTLRKALTRLVEDGVLNAAHGRGWYVSADRGQSEWPSRLESFTETARRMGLTATSIVLRSELVPASLDEAEELGLAPGTPLDSTYQVVRFLGRGSLSRAAIQLRFSALRSFYKYLLRAGVVEQSPMGAIIGPKAGKRLPVFEPQRKCFFVRNATLNSPVKSLY